MPWIEPRSAVLSAPVGAPVPPRLFTTLSSMPLTKDGGATSGNPWNVTTNAPAARAESASRWASARSTGLAPWDARVREIADVDHADAAEALRAGVLGHPLRAAIHASVSGLTGEEEQVPVDRHVVLLLGACLGVNQAWVERIRDVPDRVPLEVALEERRPAERQVGVHVVEVTRLGGNEVRRRPAGRDESKIPRGLGGIPPARF